MTLENVLNTGVILEDWEVVYILHSLINQLAILEKHGIANRDIKTLDVIIIMDPNQNDHFILKLLISGLDAFWKTQIIQRLHVLQFLDFQNFFLHYGCH